MDDDLIEILDDEIDVEEIMKTIRDNVRNRKYNKQQLESPTNNTNIPSTAQDDLSIIIPLINSKSLDSSWDILNFTYTISTHRKYLGKILVKGRQIVNAEVRRYVDPIIWNQSTFNEQVAHHCSLYEKRILDLEDALAQQNKVHLQKYKDLEDTQTQQNNVHLQKYKDLEDTLAQQNKVHLQKYDDLQQNFLRMEDQGKQIISDITHIRSEQSNNCEKISGLKRTIEHKNLKSLSNIREGLKEEITSIISRKNPESDKRLNLYGISKSDQMDYFAFEEHFRGSRSEIKERQSRYLPFFEHCANVLDIGCGRGEFLELLKDHAIHGMGVDINKEMVNYCNSKNFEAFQEDAIIFLCSLDDDCLDGVFSDQVIEHLNPDYLTRILNETYRKLKKEAYIVLGTVNILNPGGLANFFVDPTHISPIHPDYLKYGLETAGFRDTQIIFRTYDDREKNPLYANLELIAADYVMIGKK